MGGWYNLYPGNARIYLGTKPEEKKRSSGGKEDEKLRSPYKDGPFLVFMLAMMLIAFSFLQLFSTIPIYYRDVHSLSELEIGLLMAGNGIFLFLLEMPLVKRFEGPKYSIHKILVISTLLIAASFLVLNLTSWTGILIIGMLLISVGEMLNFPFGNTFAMDRAQAGGKQGGYMGLYSMGFALSHIFGHNAGMQLSDNYGWEFTWYFMTAILVIATLALVWMRRLIAKEEIKESIV